MTIFSRLPELAEVVAYAPGDPADRLNTYVDHLYEDCPLLLRQCKAAGPRSLRDLVDPEGDSLCSRCQTKWRRSNA